MVDVSVPAMTRVIYNTATSLDGFIADEQHSLEWLFAVQQDGTDDAQSEFESTVGVQVEGSTTYEWVLAQTGVLENPELWKQFYGHRPTFVFTSRALPKPEGADVRFVHGDVADHLEAIREAAAGLDVWIVGGGELAAQFVDAGALDEIRMSVAPVALGAGAPLLPRRIGSDRLTLRSARLAGRFGELIYDVS